MGFWICNECGQLNSIYNNDCSKCGHKNKEETKDIVKPKKNYRPTVAFTIVYMQNGKEMRNIIDGLNKESVRNKFLKCMNRIKESDIVDILEGEHLN